MKYNFDEIKDRHNTGAIKWAIMKHDNGFMPFSVADMEFAVAPEITEAIKKAADHGIYGYTEADESYFEALKGFMKRRHNFEIERDWLVFTDGVVPAISLAVNALTNEGDGVIIQTPVYTPFHNAIKLNNRKLVENRLVLKNGRYEMNFEELEALAKRDDVKLMILCSPHNPIGRVWERGELECVAKICLENDVIVIADEIHSDIVYEGHEHICFANIDSMKEHCIVCTAMSKTFNLAGLTCSNIIIPNAELRKRVNDKLQALGGFCVPYFARAAAITAFSKCDEWLDELIKYLKGNLDYLYNFIDEKLPQLKYSRSEGTYLAWIDFSGLSMSRQELEKFIFDDVQLSFCDGSQFDTMDNLYMRINVALPRQELKRAMEHLEKKINSL